MTGLSNCATPTCWSPKIDARTGALREDRRAAALDALAETLADVVCDRVKKVAVARRTGDADDVAAAVPVARQAYSLAHDRKGATGDHRYARGWDIRDRLRLDDVTARTCRSLWERTAPVATPWRDELVHLSAA